MAVIIGILLVIAFFALEWYVRAALLLPLPGEVRCVFSLDDDNEAKLEASVRGYRFLKRHGLIRGELFIEITNASEHTRRAAQILARRGDISIIDAKE